MSFASKNIWNSAKFRLYNIQSMLIYVGDDELIDQSESALEKHFLDLVYPFLKT